MIVFKNNRFVFRFFSSLTKRNWCFQKSLNCTSIHISPPLSPLDPHFPLNYKFDEFHCKIWTTGYKREKLVFFLKILKCKDIIWKMVGWFFFTMKNPRSKNSRLIFSILKHISFHLVHCNNSTISQPNPGYRSNNKISEVLN